MVDRSKFDIAIANMFSSQKFSEYVFYGHILSQCSLKFDNELPGLAGVSFNQNHYTLWINLEKFDEIPLEHQLGLLKHEILHILQNHVGRTGTRDHDLFNRATDISINQLIRQEHLPEGGCTYINHDLPKNLTAEQYFELLLEDPKYQKNNPKDGDGDGDATPGQQFGDHKKWEESDGDEDLKKDITKSMIEKAISKSKGNLPSNISDMLALFSRSSQVSWKKVLKNIVSNKKSNTRRTLTRVDRRFPTREDLKGKTKDRTFDLVCICDVSGSMSDNEVTLGLVEIKNICKITNSGLKLIQVDTVSQEPEDFNKNTKIFKRKASGGTYIYPGIEKMRERKIPHDAVVVITDGGTERVDLWEKALKCRVIFLTTQDNIPGIENTRYKQYNLIKDA